MDQVRRDTALGHLVVVPLGNDSLGVRISMTSREWQLSSHKGQWRFLRPEPPTQWHYDSRASLQSARDKCGIALVWGLRRLLELSPSTILVPQA
jgi:hypothetical protein